jgi:hypothetical protein
MALRLEVRNPAKAQPFDNLLYNLKADKYSGIKGEEKHESSAPRRDLGERYRRRRQAPRSYRFLVPVCCDRELVCITLLTLSCASSPTSPAPALVLRGTPEPEYGHSVTCKQNREENKSCRPS